MARRSDRKKNANGLDAAGVSKSVRAIRSSVKGKVHKSVLVRVNNICTLVERALPRANELGPGSAEMHVLSKMTTDYLPSALGPYLKMPRPYAERNALADGRTATQVLCAQLDVMYAQMWQVNNAILQSDGDRLIANGRFLEDKFGPSSFDLPGARSAAGAPQASVSPAGEVLKSNLQLASELISITAQHAYERYKNRKRG
ncbi:MAG: hypothetical protein ACOYD0_08045 [Candidatus Nanopelagicales bacterium]